MASVPWGGRAVPGWCEAPAFVAPKRRRRRGKRPAHIWSRPPGGSRLPFSYGRHLAGVFANFREEAFDHFALLGDQFLALARGPARRRARPHFNRRAQR